jgi:hypothetical protein
MGGTDPWQLRRQGSIKFRQNQQSQNYQNVTKGGENKSCQVHQNRRGCEPTHVLGLLYELIVCMRSQLQEEIRRTWQSDNR